MRAAEGGAHSHPKGKLIWSGYLSRLSFRFYYLTYVGSDGELREGGGAVRAPEAREAHPCAQSKLRPVCFEI